MSSTKNNLSSVDKTGHLVSQESELKSTSNSSLLKNNNKNIDFIYCKRLVYLGYKL